MKEIKTLSQLLDALSHGYRIQCKKSISKPLPADAIARQKEERHFCISLAGHIISIDSLHTEVYSLCREYICDIEPEIRISVNQKDIDNERSIIEMGALTYSDSYLETLVIYRKICEVLLNYDVFLMHGAVIAIHNAAYMFTACSGTGKTTHIQKWLKKRKEAFVVNGDKPLIKMTETEAIACGTPWCGKEHMGTNTMVPLKAIVFMERGEDNIITEISFGQMLPILLQQTYRPKEIEGMRKTITLLGALSNKVKFYKYIFNNMKKDAFEISYQTLTGEVYESNE